MKKKVRQVKESMTDYSDYDDFEQQSRSSARRAARLQKQTQYRVNTSSMWTGMAVFACLIGAVLAFAYFTILRQNTMALWIIIAIIALVILYAGWSFVSSDEGGAQLAGQVLGY